MELPNNHLSVNSRFVRLNNSNEARILIYEVHYRLGKKNTPNLENCIKLTASVANTFNWLFLLASQELNRINCEDNRGRPHTSKIVIRLITDTTAMYQTSNTNPLSPWIIHGH